MKGLVVEAAGKICLREDLPLPEIDAYQVLCRNVGCGICNGTDMQLINGQMPFIQYPFVLGHEAVGQVVAVYMGPGGDVPRRAADFFAIFEDGRSLWNGHQRYLMIYGDVVVGGYLHQVAAVHVGQHFAPLHGAVHCRDRVADGYEDRVYLYLCQNITLNL